MMAGYLAYFALAAVAGTNVDPCALVERDDVERVLGGPIVTVPSEAIGEETAPYCLWATAGRQAEVKLTVWSRDELPVLDFDDAESYFIKLEAEAQAQTSFAFVDGFGLRAFQGEGAVVVLKGERVIVLDFAGVAADDVRRLAALIAERL